MLQPDLTYTGRALCFDLIKSQGLCQLETTYDYMAAVARNVFDGSLACGAYLVVTGPRGTVRAEIVDQFNNAASDSDLLLNPKAFRAIADINLGAAAVSWKLADSEPVGGLIYHWRPEPNQWHCELQVRNSRYPVREVTLVDSGKSLSMKRQEYNYFAAGNAGPGPFEIQVTNIYGDTVIDREVRLGSDDVRGAAQFPKH